MKTHQNIRPLTLNKMSCRSLRVSYGVFPVKLAWKIIMEMVEWCTSRSVREGDMSVFVFVFVFVWKERRRKCTFSLYILAFFHFGSYILILPLLVPKPIKIQN